MDMNFAWVANFGTLRFFPFSRSLIFLYIYLKVKGRRKKGERGKKEEQNVGCPCIYIYANFCTIALLVWRDERAGAFHVKCSLVNILENRMERSVIYWDSCIRPGIISTKWLWKCHHAHRYCVSVDVETGGSGRRYRSITLTVDVVEFGDGGRCVHPLNRASASSQ